MRQVSYVLQIMTLTSTQKKANKILQNLATRNHSNQHKTAVQSLSPQLGFLSLIYMMRFATPYGDTDKWLD